MLSLPVAVALLTVRILVNRWSLRRHRRIQAAADPVQTGGWSLRFAVGVLALATLVTAFVTETLVGSIDAFADAAHLSEFFVAAVIVAIAGNAAEHGSAVLLAARGQLRLAAEIALASSAQVAGFLIPVVALLSWAIDPLALSFRAVEIIGMAGATIAAALVLAPRAIESRRRRPAPQCLCRRRRFLLSGWRSVTGLTPSLPAPDAVRHEEDEEEEGGGYLRNHRQHDRRSITVLHEAEEARPL